ncbi:MAG TPA: AAA domain-containing protein [Candidatus Sulfotelmatobacter sp.]|nr:AAA domain-containing protein [Candidatus Sulfotelmatobacter sp.]
MSTFVRSSGPSGPPSTPQISEARRRTVETARQNWIRKLIDLSRRNNLLYFRPLKTGTLNLSQTPPELLRDLISGEGVAGAKLVPQIEREAASKSFRDISQRALENAEEKGLSTLFATFGVATWPSLDGGRPAEAPVLMLPVAISKKEGSESYNLAATGSFQLNLVLLHVLEEQFKLKLHPEELLTEFAGDEEEGTVLDIKGLCGKIVNSMREVKDFEINLTVLLGNFAFQKMAMVKDLQERANDLPLHDLISAIAGDSKAKSDVNAEQVDPDPKQFDDIPPDNEFLVLDADSSQQRAIAAVTADQSRVIHGPPGTGKSQTITNLIASLAAVGRRVLFVAEKKAALEVVKRRLEAVGLGHLAIDLHGADLSSKKVMQQVANTLDAVRSAVPVNCQQVHSQFIDRRTRLNSHDARMHCMREPIKKSAYEMQGMLLRLQRTVDSSVRWRNEELARLTPDVGQQVKDLLIEVGGLASLFLRTDSSPWTGAALFDGAAVQNAIDLVQRANTDSLPIGLASIHEVCGETALKRPDSLGELRAQADLLDEVDQTLSLYSPQLYQRNLESILHDFSPGRDGGFGAFWAFFTNGAYRRTRAAILSVRNERASSRELFGEVSCALEQLNKWKAASQDGSLPKRVEKSSKHVAVLRTLVSNVEALAKILPTKHLDQSSLDELTSLASALQADQQTPYQLPKLNQMERLLEAAGVGKLVEEIRLRRPDVSCWPDMFQCAWIASALDKVRQSDPEIGGFIGSTHSRYVDEFTHLDEERIALAVDRVRRAHGERTIAAMNANPAGEQLIRTEAGKTRRHLPLRRVFSQAADVLTAVCPCWMASPLSVSQLLDSSKQYFDFVIFDEASQVLPEDAIPSVLRGRKLVVAGDSKQLPPTAFFAASDEDESLADEEASGTEGFESLLDTMNSFLNSSYLDWHYRSRDESLINFSNRNIYQNRLVTFPGPGGPPAISHVLVKQEFDVDGQEDSSSAEVRKVVSLILEHARKTPELTLGVITMGIRHMARVQAALDHALEENHGLAAFFDPNKGERFFIKNLERVQGDERDAIIISIGYGKDRSGNLPLRFGPLIPEGGRRRLNVAAPRAREKLIVVSSFSYLDIDLSRVRPGSGVELLRNYLQYAASNGKRLGDADLTSEPLNAFEAEVFDCLSSAGIKLIPQMGASQFRIDMVAEHPAKPGRYVLAIECDGASYHSSYTARDRDRLRQQQLENLGWRFHRIWSTDWFTQKAGEIERASKAFKEAITFADKLDQSAVHLDNHENGNGGEHISPSSSHRKRGSKPIIPVRTSIAQYTPSELAQLLRWIASDGLLRTDDQIMDEMIAVLGFSRRGARIERALKSALESWRVRA